MNPDAMLTRSAETDSGSAQGSPRPERAARRPQDTAGEIRARLAAGEFLEARRLAVEGARAHPGHAELRRYAQALGEGRSYTVPDGEKRGCHEEFEWLKTPPPEYRGKWVALVGGEVVGSAGTLNELTSSLPPNLEKTPLAVRIDA